MDLVFPDCDAATEALLSERGHLARLAALGPMRIHHGEPAGEDDLVRRVGDAEAVMIGWRFPAGAIARVPKVRIISFTGIGASTYVDIAAANARGIAVTNTPGYADVAVAEHAFALLLALTRHVTRGDADLRAGRWDQSGVGLDLSGRTIGLVGYGGIARHAARIARGFGMEVIAWTRSRAPGAVEDGVRFMPFDAVLGAADIVSIHVAETDATRGLIGAEAIGCMKPGAVLVNTARGRIVDEAALADALRGGRLAGAAVDVFGQEPMPADHPLRGLVNVVMTPHIAYRTPQATARLLEIATDNLLAFFGGKPQNVVNPEHRR
ncbi:MAG: hypothetical protein FJX57_09275 [Alphaproteobacteria bacterium]|nr:hypothetical protein [Alphaproteobacteria bacterium]